MQHGIQVRVYDSCTTPLKGGLKVQAASRCPRSLAVFSTDAGSCYIAHLRVSKPLEAGGQVVFRWNMIYRDRKQWLLDYKVSD